ncbi:MAG: polysaccharide biosynthesis/export family protein [Bacteroidota bacterium]
MRSYLYVICILLCCTSCVTHEELLNFRGEGSLAAGPVDIDNLPELEIQPDDLLSIRVKALDMEAAEPFNIDPLGMNNLNTGGGLRPLIGYLVNREGTIEFPGLGTLSVIGMTTEELRLYLQEALQPYLTEPVIMVRFLNFRVTVLGEVVTPNSFFITNERVTLLDAIGLAGDITPYGNRTNILVIREQNGQRQTARLNLQNPNVFESPYFYLQQNDIIYVEPLPARTASIRDQSQRLLPWLSAITALTTLAITLSRL